ncbi:MAG TPA: mandelate racemase/muconate lactonizing enzyme family protein [Dehalococcoidia bacterium]|nr:mandelate racemase/muconate lactonizing enzyme family protein [Dehalococcoidia bacterium]
MKVTGYETWVVRVPYEEGRTATHIILKLTTDEGLEGISYITPLVPWSQKPLKVAIEEVASRVVGQNPMATESINASFLGARMTRPQFDGLARSAASMVDIALWDLKAKSHNLPLWRLLGASNNKVRTYASWNLWFNYDLETLAQHASQHVEAGFRAMKFRLGGVRTAEECVARTKILRETVGNDVELHVDMNWGWTVDKTIRIGRQLAPYNLFWIEDPIPSWDYEGLRQISESLDTPICAGEVYHEPAQFRAVLDRHAVDIVMIDLEVGGITQWLKTAHIVQGYGTPIASHMCTEVSAHVVAAIDGLICEYIPWAIPLFKEVPPVVDGFIELTERPGLGVEFDPAALKHFAAEGF